MTPRSWSTAAAASRAARRAPARSSPWAWVSWPWSAAAAASRGRVGSPQKPRVVPGVSCFRNLAPRQGFSRLTPVNHGRDLCTCAEPVICATVATRAGRGERLLSRLLHHDYCQGGLSMRSSRVTNLLRLAFAGVVGVAVMTSGQSAEAQNLRVIPAPWVATDLTIPHQAYNGHPTTFKAIARGGSGSYMFEWDFQGDGQFDFSSTTSNRYNLSTRFTYPNQAATTTFTAKIRV